MHIADELERRDWKGHFLITTSLVGRSGFLSRSEVAELRQRGHLIGSHSHNHPDICWDLSFSEMYQEWRISCDVLKQILQEETTIGSIPGGDMNLNTLYDKNRINKTLLKWGGKIHNTRDYSAPVTIEWLNRLSPDILVINTPYWVGKKVREKARKKIVIGGHPGLVPFYRGSHSAFWAIYQGKFQDVGWSVFWVDGGVDTGDLISQKRLNIQPGDSFITLQWRGLIREAETQAKVIHDYDRGIDIPRWPHDSIPANSEYGIPTIIEYLQYKRRQNVVR